MTECIHGRDCPLCLRALIRETLCVEPCRRQANGDSTESCRKRDPKKPTTWCEPCVRTMLKEVEGDIE